MSSKLSDTYERLDTGDPTCNPFAFSNELCSQQVGNLHTCATVQFLTTFGASKDTCYAIGLWHVLSSSPSRREQYSVDPYCIQARFSLKYERPSGDKTMIGCRPGFHVQSRTRIDSVGNVRPTSLSGPSQDLHVLIQRTT